MSTVSPDFLRSVVTDVVREVLRERDRNQGGDDGRAGRHGPWDHLVTRGGARTRSQSVRIRTDEDLAQFTRQLLALFENPKNRADLRNGWLRFTLEGGGSPTPSVGGGRSTSAKRIERGAVTEGMVAAAAAADQHLVLARAAVLTPLALDKARTLGVHIEKERS